MRAAEARANSFLNPYSKGDNANDDVNDDFGDCHADIDDADDCNDGKGRVNSSPNPLRAGAELSLSFSLPKFFFLSPQIIFFSPQIIFLSPQIIFLSPQIIPFSFPINLSFFSFPTNF